MHLNENAIQTQL